MRGSPFLLGWLVIVVLSAAILTSSSAQAWEGPMLEGISNSEFHNWQLVYGHGAFYGGGCPPMFYPGSWYAGPGYFAGPAGPGHVSKKKIRSRRK
jgi:hypothetical protein